MEERALQLLEFPKLLARLAAFAVSEAGQEAVLALRPETGLDMVREKGEWFSQGLVWLAQSEYALSSFPAIDGVLRYLENPAGVPDLDALWALRQTLNQAMAARESLCGADLLDKARREWPALARRAESFLPPGQSVSALNRCLSDDGLLRDEASPELSLARGEIRRLHQGCTRRVRDFVQKQGLEHYMQDDFMTLASDRYVLPLKANFKGRLPGIIHDYSQTGETCYFEPMFLVEINNRLQELKREEREAELKVLRYLGDLLRGEFTGIRAVFSLLVDLDVVQAVSRLCALYDGTFLEFGPDRPLFIAAARHPLLALAHGDNPASPKPVPVDLALKKGQRALIISGGNAGGKTVSLKTLGLTALMGMCGLPVPAARGGSLPFWRTLHVFIGDEQSLEDHVSTFTAQVQHLSRIWDGIDAETLVILDEFGAGTDPSQGAALAQAVVDGLLERGSYIAIATHFPALKAYALSRDGVRAASVLFDPATRKPLFRLVYDQVGASQALDAAREHGLPEPVLAKARQYLLLDGEDSSQLVDRLNALAVAREREIDSLAAEREALRKRTATLEQDFAQKRAELFDRIQAQAQSVLKEWKASRIGHKQALKELSGVRKSLLARQAEETRAAARNLPAGVPDAATVSPGMSLFYIPWGKSGWVLDVDARKNRVRLDLSGITLWVEMADLAFSPDIAVPARAEASSSFASVRVNTAPRKGLAGMRLDVRGMRADVAIADLEKFLDAALMGNQGDLEIIHGRGTGVLRRHVHDFLKNYPHVASYALAPEDQGGDGVTLVCLV